MIRHRALYYFTSDVCVCLWAGGYVSDIGRSTHTSNVVIILAGLRSVGAKPALSPSRTAWAVQAKDGERACVSAQPRISQIHLWCVCSYLSSRHHWGPRYTLKALLMSRVYIRDARKQLAEQLMKRVRRWLHCWEMCYRCQSHTHTHTPQRSQSTSHRAGGDVGILVCVCVYIPVGD